MHIVIKLVTYLLLTYLLTYINYANVIVFVHNHTGRFNGYPSRQTSTPLADAPSPYILFSLHRVLRQEKEEGLTESTFHEG